MATLYLPIHPLVTLRPGMKLLHVGESGRRGTEMTIRSVSASSAGIRTVSHGNYSVSFVLKCMYLAVSSYYEISGRFDGKGFVHKYTNYCISASRAKAMSHTDIIEYLNMKRHVAEALALAKKAGKGRPSSTPLIDTLCKTAGAQSADDNGHYYLYDKTRNKWLPGVDTSLQAAELRAAKAASNNIITVQVVKAIAVVEPVQQTKTTYL